MKLGNNFTCVKGSGNYLNLDKTRVKLFPYFTRHHLISHTNIWIHVFELGIERNFFFWVYDPRNFFQSPSGLNFSSLSHYYLSSAKNCEDHGSEKKLNSFYCWRYQCPNGEFVRLSIYASSTYFYKNVPTRILCLITTISKFSNLIGHQQPWFEP